MRFRDRTDAGRRLAAELLRLTFVHPVVLALPRGGVPVAFEVAAALDVPLEVFVARKVGAPEQPELGIGAIAEGGGEVMNDAVAWSMGLGPERFAELVEQEREELARRVRHYRRSRDLPDVADRDVILVDDGLATGVTAEAALRALRRQRPRRLVLAAPACARETAARLGRVADDVVCVLSPPDFHAVGQWYDRFDQTSDDEVLELLDRAAAGARR